MSTPVASEIRRPPVGRHSKTEIFKLTARQFNFPAVSSAPAPDIFTAPR